MSTVDSVVQACSAILDAAIDLDPDAPARIDRLAGRPLEIDVEGTALSVSLVPEDGRIRLTTDPAEPAAVRLGGPPASLIAMLGQTGTSVLFSGNIHVEGDVATARAWKRLFDTLEPDWEEAVARIAGDIPAHESARMAAALGQWGRRARRARAADLRDWLINEAALLPARQEVDTWLAGVDRLRHDADRLSARVARIERHGGRS